MMSVITNSYGNVVSSFFGAKFGRHVEEMLVSPMSNATIIIGHVAGGVLRGMLVGALVTIIALVFYAAGRAASADHGFDRPAVVDRVCAGGFYQRRVCEEIRRHIDRADLCADAADLPGRRVLLDLLAAGILAESIAGQSRSSTWLTRFAMAFWAPRTSASATAYALLLFFVGAAVYGVYAPHESRHRHPGVSMCGRFAFYSPAEADRGSVRGQGCDRFHSHATTSRRPSILRPCGSTRRTNGSWLRCAGGWCRSGPKTRRSAIA